MKFFSLTVLLLVCFLVSCSKKEIEVKGEVFIVTQGAGTYKMSLVEVKIYPESIINPYIASKRDGETEIAVKKYVTAREKAKQDYSIFLKIEDKAKSQKASIDRARGSEDLETLNAALKTLDEMKWTESQYNDAKKRSDESMDNAVTALESLNYSAGAKRYFDELPVAAMTATTDGDGKFILKFDKPGKYAFAAHAQRKVSGKTEEYYWLFWVDTRESKNIMLSNNNLTDSGLADSLIFTKEYTGDSEF